VKIMLLYLLMGTGMNVSLGWIDAATAIGTSAKPAMSAFEIMGASLIFMMLCWQIPKLFAAVLGGSPALSGGDLAAIGGTLATGAMLAGTAGFGGAAAAGGAGAGAGAGASVGAGGGSGTAMATGASASVAPPSTPSAVTVTSSRAAVALCYPIRSRHRDEPTPYSRSAAS
jgi:hypothetical protein